MLVNTDYVWLALGWMAFIAIIVVVVVVALVVLVRGRSNGDRAPHAHSPESRPASPAEGETKA
ncbi:hypothetical protein D8W71_22400 [Rhodococcus sp. P1Y]|nr:hypothetical protein D8W71_22400 [Rhodococcus sp. P1Y]